MSGLLVLPPWQLEGANQVTGGGGGGKYGGGLLPAARNPVQQSTTAKERTQTVAASGTLIPVLYGKVRVPGLVFAQGMIGADLVVGYIWGVGEIHAIDTLWLNDEAVPGGVTVTHYMGTPTQTADATLSSAIAGYSDSLRIETPAGFRGIAYTVLRIPAGAIDGWPTLQAVIRGRKVYDPRIDSTLYSDNTALCLGDLITDPDYGHGVPCYGLDEAADWCDTLIGDAGDVPRCRLSYAIVQGQPTTVFIDDLAAHAECFWNFDGDGIRLIPDAPVNLETAPVITAADMLQGSLSVRAEDSTNAPTEVEVSYTAQTETAEQWATEPAIPARLPGVAEGTVTRIPQAVSFEGVYRAEEAALKAQALLARQQHGISVQWRTFDAGVLRQRGDVVKVQSAARGIEIPVRITAVTLDAPGRYSVTGTRYDASHYPGDLVLPESEGIVPVGAIVILSGDTLPDGWADFTSANGRYIIGAGGAYAVAETGGGGTITASGTTTTDGAHSSGAGSVSVAMAGGSGSDTGYTGADGTNRGAHSHAIPATEISPAPARRDDRLMIKTDTVAARLPAAARVFGLGGMTHPDFERVLSDADRIIRASSTAGGYPASGSVSITTGTTSDEHDHTTTSSSNGNPGGLLDDYSNDNGGGAHSHAGTLTATPSPARRRLALYGGLREFPVIPGCIVMWSGDIGALPGEWVLCDGDNDTPDMRGLFVAPAGTGQEGSTAGDNTVTSTAALNNRSHSHGSGALKTRLAVSGAARHSASISHTHTFSDSQAWMPEFYALAFIMYRPGI